MFLFLGSFYLTPPPPPPTTKGVLLEILGGGVPPSSLDPISDQKMTFFTPFFRPGL